MFLDRCIEFQSMFAWEVRKIDHAHFWDPLPDHIRSRLRLYNRPVNENQCPASPEGSFAETLGQESVNVQRMWTWEWDFLLVLSKSDGLGFWNFRTVRFCHMFCHFLIGQDFSDSSTSNFQILSAIAWTKLVKRSLKARKLPANAEEHRQSGGLRGGEGANSRSLPFFGVEFGFRSSRSLSDLKNHLCSSPKNGKNRDKKGNHLPTFAIKKQPNKIQQVTLSCHLPLKVDIDSMGINGGPELAIVESIAHLPELSELVDEIFFEWPAS